MTLVDLIVWLAVLVIAVIIVWFLFTQMSLPEPIQKIVLIVAVVVFGVIAIMFLLSFRGGGLRLSHHSQVMLSNAFVCEKAKPELS